ncbi:MAG: TetR family transcriptional regulator C-terminal domain-containing protein [Saprospiraceae bacterium]|nr:TetR family transcriptional regulator C-terminal domain-containing protein [Saprospiraceae bacterium]
MKNTTINHILEVGTQLISKKGFHNVGLQEVLQTAKVPKGSFYYYFKSKDDFGLQVIRYYSEQSIKIFASYLQNQALAPRDRILSFFQDRIAIYKEQEFTEGCLLGNCSLEMSDIKVAFADTLAQELDRWQALFEACIQEGQDSGNIPSKKEAGRISALLLNNWEGALLRMKASKDGTALDLFLEHAEEQLS